jgi:hypothetical protein
MTLNPMTLNPMTSQERFRLAQQLHKRAKDPRLSAKERDSALHHACNLVRINMAVAERECSDASPPKQA